MEEASSAASAVNEASQWAPFPETGTMAALLFLPPSKNTDDSLGFAGNSEGSCSFLCAFMFQYVTVPNIPPMLQN